MLIVRKLQISIMLYTFYTAEKIYQLPTINYQLKI